MDAAATGSRPGVSERPLTPLDESKRANPQSLVGGKPIGVGASVLPRATGHLIEQMQSRLPDWQPPSAPTPLPQSQLPRWELAEAEIGEKLRDDARAVMRETRSHIDHLLRTKSSDPTELATVFENVQQVMTMPYVTEGNRWQIFSAEDHPYHSLLQRAYDIRPDGAPLVYTVLRAVLTSNATLEAKCGVLRRAWHSYWNLSEIGLDASREEEIETLRIPLDRVDELTDHRRRLQHRPSGSDVYAIGLQGNFMECRTNQPIQGLESHREQSNEHWVEKYYYYLIDPSELVLREPEPRSDDSCRLS